MADALLTMEEKDGQKENESWERRRRDAGCEARLWTQTFLLDFEINCLSLCLLMTLMNWIEWMHWTWLLYDGSLMPGFFLSMFFVLPNHAVDSRGSRRLREMPFFVCLSLSKGNIANLLYIHLLVYWCLFIWSARWSDLEKHLSQWEHLKGLDPVCFLKWRVNSSDRANLHSHPSHEHLYGFSPVHVVVVQMGAIRKTIEKEDRGKI